MTDKEKNAIKDCDSIFICLDDCMSEDSANEYRKSYKILKNLIEKQSKEINEMAGYLAIIRDCPNENCGANLDCENRCNNNDDLVEECWKMYFERKIKDE